MSQPEGTANNLGSRENSSMRDIEERVSDILDNAIGKCPMLFSPPAVTTNSVYSGNRLSDGARDLMIGWQYHRIWQNYGSNNSHPGVYTSPKTNTQEGSMHNQINPKFGGSLTSPLCLEAPDMTSIPPFIPSPGHMRTIQEASESEPLALALSSMQGEVATTASGVEHPGSGDEESTLSQVLYSPAKPEDHSFPNSTPSVPFSTVSSTTLPRSSPGHTSTSPEATQSEIIAVALSSAQGQVAAAVAKVMHPQPGEEESTPSQSLSSPAPPGDKSILNPTPSILISTNPAPRIIWPISGQDASNLSAQIPNSLTPDLPQKDNKYLPEATQPTVILHPLPPSSTSPVPHTTPPPEKPLTVDPTMLAVCSTSEGAQVDVDPTISYACPTSSSQSNSQSLLPLEVPKSLSTLLSTSSASSDRLRELITTAAQMGLTLIDFDSVKLELSLDDNKDVEMSEAKPDIAQSQTKLDHANTTDGPIVPLATESTLNFKRKQAAKTMRADLGEFKEQDFAQFADDDNGSGTEFVGQIQDVTTWCLDDVWTKEKNDQGLYVVDRLESVQLQAMIRRLQDHLATVKEEEEKRAKADGDIEAWIHKMQDAVKAKRHIGTSSK
ncbi:hypothetical protein GYMLUDRAFT_250287 [Collybiopsis luxurians FD-317 M1]|uniref:Unplaced genomic scaffold GYMLUscaffold_79, whole genome shotgun sequence n=1 Tax=Collybiopsis luxurians FD-317 M1 TaxID=944289 RepID=A0A0D0C6V6_9AGAR|nr:hypothetical protein GYMLUDRAFT_250287 [Collybiopsis luxurians FD-317 M1]